MEAEKLNFITIIIFFIILLFFLVIFYYFLIGAKNFNENYKNLSFGKYFYVKYIFLLTSFFVILLSIFGIKFGEKQVKNEEKGIDMIFVLDVSKSMNTYDIEDGNNLYSRLNIAKKSISDFVVKHESDRFGLVIFAGDAVSTVPLTTDHDIFLTFLDNVDYKNILVQGSNFEKAISLGVDRFDISENRSKALVFISDGGDREDNLNYSSIKEISNKIKGINYFVAGIGSSEGGKIITGNDVFGREIYQKYNGNDVVSKLNESNLKDITSAVKGEYLKISKTSDLGELNKYINNLEKKAINTNISGEKNDFSRILAFLSFVFFLTFLILYFFENKIYLLNNNKYE